MKFRQEGTEGGESPVEMLYAAGFQRQDGRRTPVQRRVQDSPEVDRPFAQGKMIVPLAPVVVEVQLAQVRAERLHPLVDGKAREEGRVAGVAAESQALRADCALQAEQVLRGLDLVTRTP